MNVQFSSTMDNYSPEGEKMEVLVREHLSTNNVKTNTNNLAYENKTTGFLNLCLLKLMWELGLDKLTHLCQCPILGVNTINNVTSFKKNVEKVTPELLAFCNVTWYASSVNDSFAA